MRVSRFLVVGALVLAGNSAVVSTAEQRVISFDHGSLDTLDALGLGDQVVGLPKQGLPAYLKQYSGERYIDAGSLKVPDIEAVSGSAPTLILVTGRQGEAIESLEQVSIVHDATLPEGDYWQALSSNVLSLADYFDEEETGEQALSELKGHIDQINARLDHSRTVLVVTHNDGHFGLRVEPVVYDLMGFSVPALPEGVETITRGTRQFTPLTLENIAEIDPDQLLVVDRSEAIGQSDKALDKNSLRTELDALGGESVAINYLNPRLWYLSGNGLESVRLQVEEVADGF